MRNAPTDKPVQIRTQNSNVSRFFPLPIAVGVLLFPLRLFTLISHYLHTRFILITLLITNGPLILFIFWMLTARNDTLYFDLCSVWTTLNYYSFPTDRNDFSCGTSVLLLLVDYPSDRREWQRSQVRVARLPGAQRGRRHTPGNQHPESQSDGQR